MPTGSRADRRTEIQSHASALASAVGARNGITLAAVEPDSEGQTSAELWLYGIVGGYWWGFNDKTVADQLRGLNVDHITVRINSPGGDAVQGIAIGNLLRNHKASVTVVIDGLAASAASVIAIAGDEIVMSPGSQLMIHDPWFFTMGNAKELRQDADFLDKQGANLASVYAHEAGGTPEEWRAAMTADPDGTWYSADEAVTAKLATRVGTVVAVSAAPEPPADLDTEDDDMAARAAWDLEVLITPAARSAWSDSATTGAPKPPNTSVVGSITTQEGSSPVAFSDEQLTQMRKDLGLQADADEATIVAALSEVASEAAPSTPTVPEGMTLIETDVLDTLRTGATAGVAARDQQLAEKRDRTISAAIAAGKITPARKDHFEASWAADADGTEQLLASLAPGLVPVEERGHDQSTAAHSAYDDLYGTAKEA